MLKSLRLLPVLALFMAAPVFPVSPNIVISQAYGGAGCGTAGCSTYKNDYIELFNRGAVAVSVNGWSVQYGPATGTTWQVTNLPNVSIPAGGYLLVAESFGANGVSNLPAPDVTGTIAMSATAAKVALLNVTTALSGACPASASIVDFVGYGTTANCNEGGTNAPAPSTTTADLRAANGCADTDTNSADFTATTPNPRNSASALNSCSPLPSLTINDVSLNEGNAGTTSFTFTVSLSAPAGPGGVTFDIATADGTATAPSDYTAKSLTGQTIPAGSSTYSFTVLVNGDTAPEANETFLVNVGNVTGANVTDGQGQGTIVNDDAAPNLAINDVTLNEGNAGTTTFTFTVSLSAPAPTGGVTFDIATADGTATAPSDYTAKSLNGQTIPAGSSTYTFDVLANGDTTPEGDETFFVNLTNVTNAVTVDG
ncbi:MAG TPA: Calx-beta domain-containing protein, partial [Thermoanaerobaculia bacterium]|nr:Calx-beta domain-containing protein [Thermoanaerobaculia bacterium]